MRDPEALDAAICDAMDMSTDGGVTDWPLALDRIAAMVVRAYDEGYEEGLGAEDPDDF